MTAFSFFIPLFSFISHISSFFRSLVSRFQSFLWAFCLLQHLRSTIAVLFFFFWRGSRFPFPGLFSSITFPSFFLCHRLCLFVCLYVYATKKCSCCRSMLKTVLYKCARHPSVHRLLVFLFQCTSVVTLFSTACYIVDIRSFYHPIREDYSALAHFSTILWNASSLPLPVTAAPMQPWPIIQKREEPFSKGLNASLTRTGASVASTAASGYGLEKTECMWSKLFVPAAAASAIPAHLHVFFLHGNAGSHTQGNYWSCAMQHASNLLGVQISTYAFQWAEQANVHRGRLVGLQADYVADVVEAVVRGATAVDRRVEHRVWLVAHSMGGLVARLAVQLLDSFVDVGGVLTFNSPHRFPPLLLDAPMADVYRTLTAAEHASTSSEGLAGTANATVPATATTADASGEPYARLSSATLISACRQRLTEEACLRYRRRRRRRVPHLISLTSGELDLQIEPATVYPSPWSSEYAVSFFNTLDRAVCTHTTSHDGILLDPCAVTQGAIRLLSASMNEGAGLTTLTEQARRKSDPAAEFAGASARAQLPLPPGIVSRVSRIGQLLWQQHIWSWAVAALYAYALLSGLWPQIAQSAETLSRRWPARSGGTLRRATALLLRAVVSNEFSVVVFLAFFYSCTCLYAVLTDVHLVSTGQRGWYSVTDPWQWETYPQLRHTSAAAPAAAAQFAALNVLFVLMSVGPVTVGMNAGMALVAMADATLRVKTKVSGCRHAFGTARRRRAVTALFPFLVGGLYCVLTLAGVNPTTRAVAWLVLFLVLPSFQHVQPRRGERSVAYTRAVDSAESPKPDMDVVEVVFPPVAAPPKWKPLTAALEVEEWYAQHHLPGILYAALYLIQLHPFFTIRNMIVSRTFDSAATVDTRNCVTEVGLLVLLCCAVAAPTLPAFRYQLLAYVGVVASATSLLAVASMLVHPVETFRVLPALLWCFPSFLFSTLSA